MTITEVARIVPAGNWQADRVHSSLGFTVRHMDVLPFDGGFADFEAELREGRITGTARVESIAAADENLTAHLLSPEFFDAERHPELRFVSNALRRDADEVVVVGDLTVKGQTRPVELRGTVGEPVEDPYGSRRLGIELTTTIDRTDFGLDWQAELPSGGQVVANDVTITARLELVEESG